MKVLLVTSILLIVIGLGITLAGYFSFITVYEWCQVETHACSPYGKVFGLILGIAITLVGVGALLFRKILSRVFQTTKSSLLLAVIFTFLSAYIAIKLIRPCANQQSFCDHSVGFPVPFFYVSDYLSLAMILFSLLGLILDIVVWNFFSCLLLSSITKLKKKKSV